MNVPGAIVVAAGLVAGAVLVSGYGQAQSRATEGPKAASPPPATVGRFLLLASASAQEAWRIDTATGDLFFCAYKNNRVICDR